MKPSYLGLDIEASPAKAAPIAIWHIAAPLAAIALGLSGPVQARDKDISFTVQLGGSYLLSSDLGATGMRNSPLLGLQANFGATGGYFNPRLLRWAASANYDMLRGTLFDAPNALDRLGYRATLLLLGGTPLNIDLFATRFFTDSTAQGASGVPVGSSTTTLYSGTASYTGHELPSARIGLSHQESTTARQGLDPADARSTRLTLGVAQALSRFEYGVSYDTSWNSGSFAELNYQGHTLMVNMAAPLSESVRLNLFDNYYLRHPTTNASTNPRYDSNALGAGLLWRHDDRQRSWFNYAYRHDLVEAPTLEVFENSANQVSASTRRVLSDSVFVLGSLGATSARARLGDVRRDLTDQTLGLGAEWQGKYSWGAALVSGTVKLGLMETTAGEVRFTHGVSTSAVYSRTFWDRVLTSAQYSVSYDSGSAMVDGWTLTQQARLEGAWAIDAKSRLRGQFTAYSSRRDDSLLGVLLARNLFLTFEYLRGNYTAQFSGGLSDGLSDALANPISDGLFLPAAFNTHTRFATLGGSGTFDRGRLIVSANSRLGQVVAPGRPPALEGGFQVVAGYRVGKFLVSAEERFATGGSGTSRQRTNVVMVRVARSFDWQIRVQ